jgi:hypothetical protein
VSLYLCDECKDAALGRGRTEGYNAVLELLDSEVAKFKERGDLTTAEIIEVMRAKVKARSERGS